jgi:hypothetical protein
MYFGIFLLGTGRGRKFKSLYNIVGDEENSTVKQLSLHPCVAEPLQHQLLQ